MERLRYVAGASDVDALTLVYESAPALVALAGSTSELLMACRQLVAHHFTCGPLISLCAQMLTAPDPHAAADEVLKRLENDPTPEIVKEALADFQASHAPEPLVVASDCVSSTQAIFTTRTFTTRTMSTQTMSAQDVHSQHPITEKHEPLSDSDASHERWLQVGEGCHLPVGMFAVVINPAVNDDKINGGKMPVVRIADTFSITDTFSKVIIPTGAYTPAEFAQVHPTCPSVLELLQ